MLNDSRSSTSKAFNFLIFKGSLYNPDLGSIVLMGVFFSDSWADNGNFRALLTNADDLLANTDALLTYMDYSQTYVN